MIKLSFDKGISELILLTDMEQLFGDYNLATSNPIFKCIYIYVDPAISFIGIYPKIEPYKFPMTHIKMFMETLFIIKSGNDLNVHQWGNG